MRTVGPDLLRELACEMSIAHEDLSRALAEQRRTTEPLLPILVRLNLVSELELAGFLARRYRLALVTLAQRPIAPDVLRLVPPALARKYHVLPVDSTPTTLSLAMADPSNVLAIDDVAFVTGLTVHPTVATRTELAEAIDRCYAELDALANGFLHGQIGPIAEILNEFEPEVDRLQIVEEPPEQVLGVFELKGSLGETPVVKLVNMLMVDAVLKGASDIHLEPFEKGCRVRFRIDGILHEMLTLPKRLEPVVVSRLKIMGKLDITERRRPQDGRIKLRYNTREIDVRLATVPTIFGEKALLRILDKDALKLDLRTLGFDAWSLAEFERAVRQPHGMILITGPTGAGKTTTLYATLQAIKLPGVNIMTAEDPVEYSLPGVNQVQINEAVGRTFPAVLRSFLRQDPDVILVGETRDRETARVSVRAALTGHLVLSTLHTNDCASTIARLIEMGVPAFLIAASLRLVVAQRLVRRVCTSCREPEETDEAILVPYGHVPDGRGPCTLYRGKGCKLCNFTGLRGRVAIYEVMPVSEKLRRLILKDVSVSRIRRVAQSEGMKTLRQAGLMKVLEGTTTPDEVLRATLS